MADFEVLFKEPKKIGYKRNSFSERKIDNLNFAPVGESPVSDDQGISMADPWEEIVYSRVENSFLEHDKKEFVRLIREDQQI